MKVVETKTIEVRRNVCDWCGKPSQATTPSVAARSNFAEPYVLPWWKRALTTFVGFVPDAWRENSFRYDVHVGCVEEIVTQAIEGKKRG